MIASHQAINLACHAMVFDYYRKLSRADRRIYNQSDRLPSISLPDANGLRPSVVNILAALRDADQPAVQKSSARLCKSVCQGLKTVPVRVKILARRPTDDWGELYGLYEGREGSQGAVITLWMRTAQKKKVVAGKTFLRTLFHELCHHLDYEYFLLEDSFHTQGFYRRESSLYKQLAPADVDQPSLPPRIQPQQSLPVQQELF